MKMRIGRRVAARRRGSHADPNWRIAAPAKPSTVTIRTLWSASHPEPCSGHHRTIDGAVIYGEFGRVWLAAAIPLAPLKIMAELAPSSPPSRRRRIAWLRSCDQCRVCSHGRPRDFIAVKVGPLLTSIFRRGTRARSGKKFPRRVNQAHRAESQSK